MNETHNTPGTPELPDDLINPTQASLIAHCSQCTLWRWIRLGTLRAWRIGTGRLLVSESEVKAMIQPVLVRPALPKRDKSGERMTRELNKQAEARTRKLLKLPAADSNGAA